MIDSETRTRCIGMTLAGERCKNGAQAGTDYCFLHMPSDLARKNPVRQSLAGQNPARETEGGAAPLAEGEWVEAMETQAFQIPVEEELTEEVLSRRLRDEIMALFGRLQKLYPGMKPLSDSSRRFAETLGRQADRLPGPLQRGPFAGMRRLLNDNLLDAQTWRGLWYMVNYTLKYQGDMVKRRLTGDYETDEWGLDWEFVEAVRPFLDFLYKFYWRVETTGIEHLPDYDRALLVSNHSGQLPWDGLMIMTAVLGQHPAQRMVRNLYADWYPNLPFAAPLLVKMGQALASVDNGVRLLEQEELVGAFPEGYRGANKLFKDRYRLARFASSGFVRMALKSGAPMIPVSVVGAEETYVSIGQSQSLARLMGVPVVPVSLRFPWLGPLGLVPLPTKWWIDFGEPVATDQYGPEAAGDQDLVATLADQMRETIQGMVDERLAQRRSPFF